MSPLHRAALRSWAERERVAHPTEGQRSSNLLFITDYVDELKSS